DLSADRAKKLRNPGQADDRTELDKDFARREGAFGPEAVRVGHRLRPPLLGLTLRLSRECLSVIRAKRRHVAGSGRSGLALHSQRLSRNSLALRNRLAKGMPGRFINTLEGRGSAPDVKCRN